MSIELHHTRIGSWPAVILQNDAMRVIVVPEIGAKIISLQSLRNGREWLWKNPHLPLIKPPLDAIDFGASDAGGWDEVFPTVNPCRVPTSAWGDRTLTDHGELWFRSWHVLAARVDSQNVALLTLAVDEPDLPFRFERTLTLSSGLGPLAASYSLTNKSNVPMPFIWAAHPLIAIEPGDIFDLPKGTRISSTGCVGVDLAPDVKEFEWPSVTLASGKTLDLSHAPARSARFAIKLFAQDVSSGTIEIADRAKREALRLSSNSPYVQHLGLWLNFGAWSGANTQPYYNAGIEPTNFPQDDLSASLGNCAPELLPSATRSWALTISINRSGEY